ncbi:unnamed protein product [Ectocarpus fasciculatus]
MIVTGRYRSRTVQLDGKSYMAPSFVSHRQIKRVNSQYQYIIMMLQLGCCEVNGKKVSKKVKISYSETKIAMETFMVVR